VGGCKDAACVTTWISESQDQDLCSRNSTSHSTHNNVTSCLMSLSADVFFSQFFFPPRLLHCNSSSLLVVTPILKPEAALFKETQTRGLTGIYIRTAFPRSQSSYLMWIPSQNRFTTAVHAVVDGNLPGSPVLTTNPRSFCFLAITSQ